MCNLETIIPSGDDTYPDYHHECYYKSLVGTGNPRYRPDSKVTIKCAKCAKLVTKWRKAAQKHIMYCSRNCATSTHCKNLSKIKVHNGTMQTSKLEQQVYEQIKLQFPSAINQHIVGYYSYDIFIPETNELIEVHGDYWHSLPKAKRLDKSKATYTKTYFPQYKIGTIWGSEVKSIPPDQWYNHAMNRNYQQNPNNLPIYILCGPSGSGKSFLSNDLSTKYEIVDYDKLSFQACCNTQVKDKPIVIITPIQAKRMANHFRARNITTHLVYLKEPNDIIQSRLESRGGIFNQNILNRIKRYESLEKSGIFHFVGNQEACLNFLLK